jgi:hypothetical protein
LQNLKIQQMQFNSQTPGASRGEGRLQWHDDCAMSVQCSNGIWQCGCSEHVTQRWHRWWKNGGREDVTGGVTHSHKKCIVN